MIISSKSVIVFLCDPSASLSQHPKFCVSIGEIWEQLGEGTMQIKLYKNAIFNEKYLFIYTLSNEKQPFT